MMRKIGKVLAHTCQAGMMGGRARSERRDVRVPDLGAAMRVRLGAWRRAACLKMGRDRWIWVGGRRSDSSIVESRNFMVGQRSLKFFESGVF